MVATGLMMVGANIAYRGPQHTNEIDYGSTAECFYFVHSRLGEGGAEWATLSGNGYRGI